MTTPSASPAFSVVPVMPVIPVLPVLPALPGRPSMPGERALERRGSSSLAVRHERPGRRPSRPADRGSHSPTPPNPSATPRTRGFPGSAAHSLTSPHCTAVTTPVPTPAHRPVPRAIRVRRSPR